VRSDLATIEAVTPAAQLRGLQTQLAALTAGDGVLESTFDGYRPVPGAAPSRERSCADPRLRKEYLLSLTRQGGRPSL
jgi:ribosomal protection tetracycline resistance protein